MAFLVREVNRLLFNQLVHLRIILSSRVEGREPNNHFIGQDTQSPPVHWEGVAALNQDLWGQVVWSTAEGVGLCISFEHFGETEVSEADVSILVHQDVLRFKISINDVFGVQVTQSHGDLQGIELGAALWESSHSSQVREELSSTDEPHDEEDLLVCLEDIAHAHKEGVVCLK